MRISVLALALCVSGLTLQHTGVSLDAQSESRSAPAVRTSRPTEQQWIVSEVVAAIAGIAAPPAMAAQPVPVRVVPSTTPSGRDRSFMVTTGASQPIEVVIVGHLWSPETFRPVAEQLLQPQGGTASTVSTSTDNAARRALTNLTVETLLDENDRISALLEKDMRSPDAHEAAALLIGASNPDLQAEANDLLRPLFPSGLEPLVRHNLAPVPWDGVAFATFGPRPLALGMQFRDIIVSVDGWRVRTASQYAAVTRFQHDDLMALTVWRDGRYQDLQGGYPSAFSAHVSRTIAGRRSPR